MRTATTARRLPILIAGLALLAACSDSDDTTGSVELDGAETTETDTGGSSEDGATTEEPTADADAGSDNSNEETTDPDADDETGAGQADNGDDGAGASDLVDMTEAEAGTWPVGDAGTVRFAIDDGALVLEDVTTADGWRSDVDEQDPDEIEVDFRRDEVEWQIEIELVDGGTLLEIEIDQDIENAGTGGYDVGDAGTFTFSVPDGRLVLDDLDVADGWTLAERDEEADEIEFELTNGPRRFDVQIELDDDGSIDIEIDYEVVGPVAG